MSVSITASSKDGGLDRLPVAVPAVRHEWIQETLQLEERPPTQKVDQRRTQLTQRLHGALAVVEVAGPAGADDHHGTPVQPEQRVTVRFRFRQGRRRVLWLVLEGGECSVCLTDPGYEVDLHVDADLAAFYEVWLGRRSFAATMRAGDVRLEGPGQLVRAFPTWLRFSLFADDVRAATRAAAS